MKYLNHIQRIKQKWIVIKMDMLVKDNKNIIKYYLEAKMLFSFERSRVCR